MVAEHSVVPSPFWPEQPARGSWGMGLKLASNFFQIASDAKESLFVYDVSFSPDLVAFSLSVQSAIERSINEKLEVFKPFFRRGRRLYSRCEVSLSTFIAKVHDEHDSPIEVSVKVEGVRDMFPIPANSKDMSVLFEFVLDKLVGLKGHQKLGNLFYNSTGRENDKIQVVGGFSCSAGFMHEIGHFLTVDSLYRAVHRKNLLESMISFCDSLMSEHNSDADPQGEWHRRCGKALVFSYVSGKVYRVKKVRFDLDPSCSFILTGKKAKLWANTSTASISYVDYYRRFYNRLIYDNNQPLVEAYAEKRSETVILVPELCALTGLTDEMKKDRMLMNEVLQYSRVGTGDKLNQSVAICRDLFNGATTSAPVIDTSSCSGKARQLMREWKCSLSHVPARVEARVLEPCEVSFGQKRYMVEDGNFQRWTRNGSQCPVQLNRWIVIHTEPDRQLADMWLRSMRELGGSGFGMLFGEPLRVVMNGNAEELNRILLDQITPDIQLVMMFTPQKDSNKLYRIFKNVTATVRPCITQVVKSETMRKRQSIVAIVTRVVMQISAKLLGPLWHVNLETPITPMMSEPTMIVGIDTHESKEFFSNKKSVLGFVASLDAFVSQYYSTSVLIDEESSPDLVAQKIRLCMHEAFEAFADSNEGILPTNIVVYRNNVSRQHMKRIGQCEIEAILDSIKATNSETWDQNDHLAPAVSAAKTKECAYDPCLTYVMSMKHVPARFYMMGSPEGAKNPPPGTVLDPVSDLYSFYLVNQHVSRGSAAPTQYIVAYDSSTFSVDALQNLTFKLSHMYYNFPGAVRLPAPAQYAKKLAHMVATSVQAHVHPRLKETLFYL